ncbi:hypothetical protein CLF_112885 [Clonorchis sinensis]|uniref:GIY-YIG domain-containing protein n=1 Tax=Clonorchis sinensis TaxID=79923 RepID=G7YX74_CLOSI|nr:hypothetical protein CLF_112885 [Clonorchis sinensis]
MGAKIVMTGLYATIPRNFDGDNHMKAGWRHQKQVAVDLYAELGNWLANVSSPYEETSSVRSWLLVNGINFDMFIPYIKNTAEMTARLLRQHNITVAYKPAHTLRKTLSRPKGKLDPMTRNNVIYRIQCKDCDKRYIGQTGRKLSTRIHEHKLATERRDQFSLISVHKDQEGHEFDWSGVHILGQARTKKEREFIEAWYSTKGSINKHIEIDPIYQQLRARKKYPPNCALMMSPRMVTKRLQANCQARRTDQQPPDQQPIDCTSLFLAPKKNGSLEEPPAKCLLPHKMREETFCIQLHRQCAFTFLHEWNSAGRQLINPDHYSKAQSQWMKLPPYNIATRSFVGKNRLFVCYTCHGIKFAHEILDIRCTGILTTEVSKQHLVVLKLTVSIQEDTEVNQFTWDNVQILACARTKRDLEFAGKCYFTQNSVNKHINIDIDPVYQPPGVLHQKEVKRQVVLIQRRRKLLLAPQCEDLSDLSNSKKKLKYVKPRPLQLFAKLWTMCARQKLVKTSVDRNCPTVDEKKVQVANQPFGPWSEASVRIPVKTPTRILGSFVFLNTLAPPQSLSDSMLCSTDQNYLIQQKCVADRRLSSSSGVRKTM